MEVVTLDFETYYDKEYSLTKLTTEAYIRDPRFEVIMLGIRWPDGSKELLTGTHEEIRYRLDAVDWSVYAVLAHNCVFDAAILAWHFGVRPRAWLDTLSMARGMFGSRNNSLAMLAKRFGLEDKGTYVTNMMGRRRASLSQAELRSYGEYCLKDVDLCFDLWTLMSNGWYDVESVDVRELYPLEELKLIDQHIRMFTEPVLRLNLEKLLEYQAAVAQKKAELLSRTEFSRDALSSNPKFAEILRSLGVTLPMKVSKITGKATFAFAKTDPEMKALLDHENPIVQAVAAARLGVKSTLEETRIATFIGIAERDPRLPVPLKYSYARTKRSSGSEGINMQNLPARSGTQLKDCIEAPPGHVVIDCDSSNIEARVLPWLAQQDDLVRDFAAGVDVYCKMAGRIYNRTVTKADVMERFLGKTVILGCGYGTGALKLQLTLQTAQMPMKLPLEECQQIIDTYRNMYPLIRQLWRDAERAIEVMYQDKSCWLGREGVLLVEGRKGIRLPSGLYISYPQLHKHTRSNGKVGWAYKDDTGIVDLYGAKLVENVTQALARIIVMSQLLRITRKYKVALTVHDSNVAVVPEAEREEAQAYIESCMRWTPKWAEGLPINCESHWGYSYGSTK